MLAVILAAGKGTRMLPLTQDTPKPLLKVLDKPLLEHIIDALPPEVSEIVLVVGYHGEQIKEHFGELYEGRQITYVQQDEPKGTYHALLTAKDAIGEKLTGKFILMNADDIHGSAAIADAIQKPLAILVSQHEDPTKFGMVLKNEDGTLRALIERPEVAESTIISTGTFVLDDRVFDYEVVREPGKEFYVTDAVQQLARDFPLQVIEQSEWIPIGNPDDLKEAEEILKARHAEQVREEEEKKEEKD